MITFKPITIEDKAEIESFTLPYAPANCDLAFANMFCWQFQFKTAWSVVDGFLVIRFQIGAATGSATCGLSAQEISPRPAASGGGYTRCRTTASDHRHDT